MQSQTFLGVDRARRALRASVLTMISASLALGLAACGAPAKEAKAPAKQPVESVDVKQAAQNYLAAVCPLQTPSDSILFALAQVTQAEQQQYTAAQLAPFVTQAQDAAGELAKAYGEAATTLTDPETAWPKSAAAEVAAVAKALTAEQKQLAALAKTGTAAQFTKLNWDGSTTGAAIKAAREKLALATDETGKAAECAAVAKAAEEKAAAETEKSKTADENAD